MGRGAISCRHQRQGRANEARQRRTGRWGDGELAQARKVASEMCGTARKAAIAVIALACVLGTAEATVAIAKTAAGGACALSTALKKTARAALEDAVSARDSMMAAKAEVLATRRAIDALAQGEGGASAKCGDERLQRR
ncbi:hypothetical protein ERJ75_001833200 [Trypanosoma vivax]|nr:hypothetical protein ERJ75_001833200 [Trypanosoma vivax]